MTTTGKTLLAVAVLGTLACSQRPSSTTHPPSAAADQETRMTNADTVRTFLSGFNDPAQIETSFDLLADDYAFKNPMVELKSKAEFIPLAQSIGAALTGLEVVHVVEKGEWVAAYYVFKSEIPGVEVNPATEWFRVEDGLIQESHLIYDASQWRKVYAAMESE